MPTKRVAKTNPSPKTKTPPTLEAWVQALVEGASFSPPPADALDDVTTCFGLDELERAVLLLLAAVERSYPLQRALAPVTAGALRSLLGSVESRLAPDAPLRRHALVNVAEPRLVAATDLVRLEVGLEPRISSLPQGLSRVAPQASSTSELAKRLTSAAAQVVLHELACTVQHAQSVADGLRRPVVFGRVRRPDLAHVARLRRDADLEAAVLWFESPSAELLEVLLVHPPRGLPALVILSDVPTEPSVPAPWQLRREKVVVEATAAPRNELDYIRQLAQRDAERAMGIVRKEVPQAPRLSVPGRIVDASVRVVEEKPPEPVEAKPEPKMETEPAPKIASEPMPQPEPVAAAAPEPAPAAQDDEGPDGPRMDVAADASLDVRARAAMQSGSAQQRIELLESLAGLKHPSVIAALRHNVTNEHARLKATAERIMGQMFGPAWNRSRAISKPIQPPRTEE